jgi:ABC-type uncharacterized transport system permease subunit
MARILLHLLVATLYASLWFVCRPERAHESVSRTKILLTLTAAILGHAFALAGELIQNGELVFGFINTLSLTIWFAMLFYLIENTLKPLTGLLLFAAPVAALISALPILPGGHPIAIPLTNWAAKLHIFVGVCAYSLFTLAAFHAVLILALEKRLHGNIRVETLGRLPPLLSLEHLLFTLIHAAFFLLTLTVGTGVFFSEQLFGSPFALTHKSAFSILAWFVFGTLILGRRLRGWRGQIALRWTLSGLLLMLLAYAGSRFVLEFLLGRSV